MCRVIYHKLRIGAADERTERGVFAAGLVEARRPGGERFPSLLEKQVEDTNSVWPLTRCFPSGSGPFIDEGRLSHTHRIERRCRSLLGENRHRRAMRGRFTRWHTSDMTAGPVGPPVVSSFEKSVSIWLFKASIQIILTFVLICWSCEKRREIISLWETVTSLLKYK